MFFLTYLIVYRGKGVIFQLPYNAQELIQKLTINKGNSSQVVIRIICIMFESDTVRFGMSSSSGYRDLFVASVSFGDLSSGEIVEGLSAGLILAQVTDV